MFSVDYVGESFNRAKAKSVKRKRLKIKGRTYIGNNKTIREFINSARSNIGFVTTMYMISKLSHLTSYEEEYYATR